MEEYVKDGLHYVKMSDGKWWAFPVEKKKVEWTLEQMTFANKTLVFGYASVFILVISMLCFIFGALN